MREVEEVEIRGGVEERMDSICLDQSCNQSR